ncbi:hypothetical protein [Oscillibacter sp.]|uniref:hypothetical protein n=1 Tax=Oscillibacter sp. TaxID=1945593 RepID=UPI002603B5A1|nr:hypothetical protein [Oscillibacter sp.]MDD3346135.1 hypothetical protein [Oscillibacter sp.]
MGSISKEYLFLFNAITNTEKDLEHLRQQLIDAQRQAEEMFLEEPADGEEPAN